RAKRQRGLPPDRPTAVTRKQDWPPPHRTWRRRTEESLGLISRQQASRRDAEGNPENLAHDGKGGKWITVQQARRFDVLAPSINMPAATASECLWSRRSALAVFQPGRIRRLGTPGTQRDDAPQRRSARRSRRRMALA